MAACPICATAMVEIGTKTGQWSARAFDIERCSTCGLTRVANPWTDFDEIYGDEYYAGRGADPLVDYIHELEHPDTTIRRYEWRGIVAAVRRACHVDATTRWLDYGCGTGGLVLHLRRQERVQAIGYEEGWSVPRLHEQGVPVLDRDQVGEAAGTFDVVTAVEVIEHLPDPIPELRRMADLLRPGGVLFLTTGNSAPHRKNLLEWPYLIPEIHVSLFEPRTVEAALKRAGLVAEFSGYGPGWSDIIRFKILKNLGRRDVSALERVVPWSLAARGADRRWGLAAHPIGRKPRLTA